MARRNAGVFTGRFNWELPAITLDGCMAVAEELATASDQPINMKLAMWAGVTSINTKLRYNGNATRRLARFADGRLPGTFEEVKQALNGTSFGMLGIHYRGLQAAQQAQDNGTLPPVPQDGWTVEQWLAWRDAMVKRTSISWKVASFIGLLCCPLTCPLVPVDIWVMRRLGLPGDGSPQSRKAYMAVEEMVRQERDAAGHSNLPLGVWHWYKWSQARQAAVYTDGSTAEPATVKPESHLDVSPRLY